MLDSGLLYLGGVYLLALASFLGYLYFAYRRSARNMKKLFPDDLDIRHTLYARSILFEDIEASASADPAYRDLEGEDRIEFLRKTARQWLSEEKGAKAHL